MATQAHQMDGSGVEVDVDGKDIFFFQHAKEGHKSQWHLSHRAGSSHQENFSSLAVSLGGKSQHALHLRAASSLHAA
jgi:hypothetical protein